jgi:beta-glucosidase
MRKTAPILAAISLSVCLGLSPQTASTAIENSLKGSSSLPIPSVSADTDDSDEFFQSAIRSRAQGRDYSPKIEALLKQMTVEEKVGQMTQLTLEMIVTGHDQSIEIDPAKLQKAIGKYGVGSILNCYNQALTAEKWQNIITQIQTAAKKTRLGIPVIYGIDSIHGANYVQGSTLFPQEIGMAATWNPELMKRGSEISAMETRAVGIPWSFSPVLDIGRQPLWSRFWETFGEDPYLAKVMGVAFVRGGLDHIDKVNQK